MDSEYCYFLWTSCNNLNNLYSYALGLGEQLALSKKPTWEKFNSSANRVNAESLSKFADCVTLSKKNTADYLQYCWSASTTSGCPSMSGPIV